MNQKLKRQSIPLLQAAEIDFSYTMSGFGWAVANVRLGNNQQQVSLSYLGGPLNDLLDTLLALKPIKNKQPIDLLHTPNRLPKNRANLLWKGEPWFYDWQFANSPTGILTLQLENGDDHFFAPQEKQQLFKIRCRYKDFTQKVIHAAVAVLQRHGLEGYFQSWGDRIEFPRHQLFQLLHDLYPESFPPPTIFFKEVAACSLLDEELTCLQKIATWSPPQNSI